MQIIYIISVKHIIKPNSSQNGYDAGFIKDEYSCNSDQCKCAHFDQIVIG